MLHITLYSITSHKLQLRIMQLKQCETKANCFLSESLRIISTHLCYSALQYIKYNKLLYLQYFGDCHQLQFDSVLHIQTLLLIIDGQRSKTFYRTIIQPIFRITKTKLLNILRLTYT